MRNIRGKNKALVNAKHDAMFAKGGNSQDSVVPLVLMFHNSKPLTKMREAHVGEGGSVWIDMESRCMLATPFRPKVDPLMHFFIQF